MDNNGGQNTGSQNTGYAGSAYVKESSKSGKVSGLAVVLMIVFLAVGFGGGAVVGGLMAGGTGTVEEDGSDSTTTTEPTTTSSSAVDTTMQDELDNKIDAYESAFSFGSGLRAFHESYLTPEVKLQAVFASMKDNQTKGIVEAFQNSSYPYETTISLDDVETAYASLFGEEMSESDRVNITVCNQAVPGNFTYDAENNQYKAELPNPLGCGGTSTTWYDSYRDSYTMNGKNAYVTIEIGRKQFGVDAGYDQAGGIFSDVIGGTPVSELVDSADFVNESNKDSFTKYQYVFEKQESGAWALKGLYPTEK